MNVFNFKWTYMARYFGICSLADWLVLKLLLLHVSLFLELSVKKTKQNKTKKTHTFWGDKVRMSSQFVELGKYMKS